MKNHVFIQQLNDDELRSIYGGSWFGDFFRWIKKHFFVRAEDGELNGGFTFNIGSRRR